MVISMTATDMTGEFQLPKQKQSSNKRKSHRLYIGNLPGNVDQLGNDLLELLKENANFSVSQEDISVVRRPGQKQTQSCHAFLNCPTSNDADHVISTLNRHQFYSERLVVQRERKNKGRNHNNDNNSRSNGTKPAQPSSFGNNASWSKPAASHKPSTPKKSRNETAASKTPQSILKNTTDDNHLSKQNVDLDDTDFISEIVSTEMQAASATGDEAVVMNSAIASMAAVSFLSSALGEPDNAKDSGTVHAGHAQGTDEIATIDDFRARCQKPLSELLDDYGEEDPNWQHVIPKQSTSSNVGEETNSEETNEVKTIDDFRARCQQPLSTLLNDYGEHDPDWQEFVPTAMPPTKGDRKVSFGEEANKNSIQASVEESKSRLGRHGKAPVHIELVSFGYTHGAPPEVKRGWSHTQPLPAFECRDLPEVPGYLAWRDGVSGYVQRTLLTEPVVREIGDKLSEQSFAAIQEAINEGGHGYASPLQMKVYVGSETGRHRSVVVCEQAAKLLRNLLRKNENDCVSVPVSVGTFHRDVERAIKKKKEDRNARKKDDMDDF